MQNFIRQIVKVSRYFWAIFKENSQDQIFSIAVFTAVCDIIWLWYHQSLECLNGIQIFMVFKEL